MFGRDTTVAVQDPAYPVYVDSSVMMGMTGDWEGSGFGRVSYMRCTPDTDFFPVLESAPRADLVFFCSPNNPTGAAATRSQLERLVEFARRNGSIIVYDAAYALYISDPDCPKSIFEIPGAEEVALETCSFSKYAGFTGVRLGWTVVPQQLRFQGERRIMDSRRLRSDAFRPRFPHSLSLDPLLRWDPGARRLHARDDHRVQRRLLRRPGRRAGRSDGRGLDADARAGVVLQRKCLHLEVRAFFRKRGSAC